MPSASMKAVATREIFGGNGKSDPSINADAYRRMCAAVTRQKLQIVAHDRQITDLQAAIRRRSLSLSRSKSASCLERSTLDRSTGRYGIDNLDLLRVVEEQPVINVASASINVLPDAWTDADEIGPDQEANRDSRCRAFLKVAAGVVVTGLTVAAVLSALGLEASFAVVIGEVKDFLEKLYDLVVDLLPSFDGFQQTMSNGIDLQRQQLDVSKQQLAVFQQISAAQNQTNAFLAQIMQAKNTGAP